MNEILGLLKKFIHWIGHAKGKAGSLTHPEFVAWKGVETAIDAQQFISGFILNAHAKLFQLLKVLHLQKNALQQKEDYPQRLNECKSQKSSQNNYASAKQTKSSQDKKNRR